MQENTQTTETLDLLANNDAAETWDHLCGPDPHWGEALEEVQGHDE